MSHQALMLKVSQLHNNSGMLAHALHTGIKPTVQHQLARVWECVKAMTEEEDRKAWRDLTKPQEVFIDPESIHAYCKLQSSLSAFVTAVFLGHPHNVAVAHITYYIEYICTQCGIDHKDVFK